ncbi:MAG: membrane protein insertion efficiency factor YidD [Betaproteobacteria bacterium]|nr:membrane protein insertion efficiency factor YidD [Betaproteobacteria bacterium]
MAGASLGRRLLSAPIHAYRYAISPMMAPACRFFPSCSEYALEAIARHGVLSGGWLAARRLCRCHPWNPGGLDPVPPSPKSE